MVALIKQFQENPQQEPSIILTVEQTNALYPLTRAELISLLEWAGCCLLSMQIANLGPSGYKSQWPNYANDANLAYGYTGERLRPAIPSAAEIQLMDKILELPQLVDDVLARRIINARALVKPITNQYLFPWTKIAQLLQISKFRVRSLHQNGINEIMKKMPPPTVYMMKHSIPLLRQGG